MVLMPALSLEILPDARGITYGGSCKWYDAYGAQECSDPESDLVSQRIRDKGVEFSYDSNPDRKVPLVCTFPRRNPPRLGRSCVNSPRVPAVSPTVQPGSRLVRWLSNGIKSTK